MLWDWRPKGHRSRVLSQGRGPCDHRQWPQATTWVENVGGLAGWEPGFARGPQRSGLDLCLPFHTSLALVSPGRKGNTGNFSRKLLDQASICLLGPKGVGCDVEEDGLFHGVALLHLIKPWQGMRGSFLKGCSGLC